MGSFEVFGQPIGTERFFVIAGPCVLESESLAFRVADTMASSAVIWGSPISSKVPLIRPIAPH